MTLGVSDTLRYSFKAEKGSTKILKGSLVVMKGMRTNDVYVMCEKL